MDKSTQSELLDAIADYADVVSGATESEQSKSMRAAFALDDLYEQGDWVAAWLVESPEPTSKRALAQWQPDSRNRFTKWVEWVEGTRDRQSPAGRTQYQLLAAAEIATDLRLRQNTIGANANVTERVLRPLKWMYSQEREEHVPEVWARAIKIAGSRDALTAKIVTQARNEWKTEVLGASGRALTPTKQVSRGRQSSGYRDTRIKIRGEIENFANIAALDHTAWDEWATLLDEIEKIANQIEDKFKKEEVA